MEEEEDVGAQTAVGFHLTDGIGDEDHEIPEHVAEGHAAALEGVMSGGVHEAVSHTGVLHDCGRGEVRDGEGGEEGDHVGVPDLTLEGLELGERLAEQHGRDNLARDEDAEAERQREEGVVEKDLQRDALAGAEDRLKRAGDQGVDQRTHRTGLERERGRRGGASLKHRTSRSARRGMAIALVNGCLNESRLRVGGESAECLKISRFLNCESSSPRASLSTTYLAPRAHLELRSPVSPTSLPSHRLLRVTPTLASYVPPSRPRTFMPPPLSSRRRRRVWAKRSPQRLDGRSTPPPPTPRASPRSRRGRGARRLRGTTGWGQRA